MTTNRFGLFCLASLLGTTLMSGVALAQNAPPPQGYPDPNAQPQYPPQQQPPQQYPQQPGYPQQQPGYPPQDYQQQPQQQQQPGYPPQQYPQQPGYPQQQPGYPQQQPGYPPQQYPQQPGYAPPPGYGTPPGYGPPAGYSPPPTYAPSPPAGHHGLLLMGYLGIHAFEGAAGDNYGPGLRVGGMLGFYLNPVVSVNGELSIDIMNLKTDTGFYTSDDSAARVVFSFSPLFHLPVNPQMEVVLGPKFGAWVDTFTFSDNSSADISGYLLGLNAGVFVRTGRMSLGGLFSFDDGVPTQICDTNGLCGTPADKTSEKVIAFNGAILF
jgi:hypothetical protein